MIAKDKIVSWDSRISQHIEYRAEDRGAFVVEGREIPDFRVVLYVNGEWENEWDNGWSERKATEIADRLNNTKEMA
tara:strand:+ start:247 stop:474 length:228 start_codon:yes stop_codon:yes gene_type:complete